MLMAHASVPLSREFMRGNNYISFSVEVEASRSSVKLRILQSSVERSNSEEAVQAQRCPASALACAVWRCSVPDAANKWVVPS
jgi:hypothetical protein